MSLNGDLLIMRNGRSTSQVSIYNYPEHLNPFYEDDQHKRLRFWKINKKNGDEVRRNSFSVSNLKDIWTFKSFRLKKKSSTLGINKTSESPPPLRREYLQGYAAIPNPANGDGFQRNMAYRSSLQNVHSTQGGVGGFGFNRNDQYRNTLTITPPRRYGASLTPQPHRSSELNRGNFRETLTRGSSQTSVNTNPFDTDNEVDNEDVSFEEKSLTSSTAIKKIQRKKRRAPAPPNPGYKDSVDESSNLLNESSHKSSEHKLHIEEEEIREIANLTAEIESFVKTTSNDSPERELITSNRVEPKPKIEAAKRNGAVPKEPTPSKLVRRAVAENNADLSDKSANKLSKLQQDPEVGHIECIHIHVDGQRAALPESEPSRVTSFRCDKKGSKEKITTTTSFTLSSPPAIKKREAPKIVNNSTRIEKLNSIDPNSNTELKFQEAHQLKITEDYSSSMSTTNNLANSPKPPIAVKPILESKIVVSGLEHVHKPNRIKIPKTPAELVKNFIEEEAKHTANNEPLTTNHNETNKVKADSIRELTTTKLVSSNSLHSPEPLKIIESEESILISNNGNQSNGSVSPPIHLHSSINDYAALYRTKPATHLDWKKSTLAPLENNVPPEKRKSVKDIIESINRSQRLLNAAAHKDQVFNSGITNHLKDGESAEHASTSENLLTPLALRKYSEPNNNFSQNTKSLDDSQHEVKRIYKEITAMEYTTEKDTANNPRDDPSDNLITTPIRTNNDPQKLDNEEIFKKCQINKEVYDYRESSPTASNLDWNPVPKPKRNKHLSNL